MRTPKEGEAARIMREHLVRVLSEQVERTFSADGPGAGLRMVTDLFGRLDDTALRELAYKQGLTTESDLEPDEAEQRG